MNVDFNSIESVQAALAQFSKPMSAAQEEPSQVQVPENPSQWEKPAHEEVDLAVVEFEDLGLDPFNFDDPLVKAIYRAQINASAPAEAPTEPQPTPFDGALEMQRRGVPLIPLRPRTKIAFQGEWEQSATHDLQAIQKQHEDFPDANWACVAKAAPGGFVFFEVDRQELVHDIERMHGKKFPDTLMVRSSPGRGHVYFKHTAKSLALGNAQAKDAEGELWSLRADDRYVVAPLSWHPTSGKQYEIIKNVEIAEIPDWLVEYCAQTKTATATNHPELDSKEPILEGGRNNALTSILGKARQVLTMDKEQLYEYGLSVNRKRCVPPLSTDEVRKIANSVGGYDVKPAGKLEFGGVTTTEEVPIIDDPADNDPRFEMKGDAFDSKVYDELSERATEYPNPGDRDWISTTANKLVHGTSIPLAFVREPLKAIVLHALDGKLIHPAYPKLSLRGNYFSLAESEGGKTTGLEFAIQVTEIVARAAGIHFENLFRYKSETTFIRSFTPEGTTKTDKDGNIKSGQPGHPSQFLYIKEGNLVANSSDFFAAVFAQLTNLYDQTEAGTESMTNGNFTARTVKASTVMCFTPSDFKATFGGKGNIGGGGLNRWALVNPPPIKDYDAKDWERLTEDVIQQSAGELASVVFRLRNADAVVLTEEPGAARIRLEVKAMLKQAGKVGKRLLDYFMREQVAQAATAVDGRLVMTTEQAEYAKQWVLAQVECRLNCWPSDANNQIEAMEHAIRKSVTTHYVSETKLKDVCHFYREGSGGWFVYSSAVKNMLDSVAIKWTGRTRKGTRAFCPGFCTVHAALKDEKPRKAKS